MSPARTIRDLRAAMFLSMGAVAALGVVASAILIVAGTPEARLRLWPGLTSVMIGQAGALLAGIVVVTALRRTVSGADKAGIRVRTATALRRVARSLLGALVVTTAVWTMVEPGAGIEALVGALVGAQAAFPVTLAARTLERSPLSP